MLSPVRLNKRCLSITRESRPHLDPILFNGKEWRSNLIMMQTHRLVIIIHSRRGSEDHSTAHSWILVEASSSTQKRNWAHLQRAQSSSTARRSSSGDHTHCRQACLGDSQASNSRAGSSVGSASAFTISSCHCSTLVNHLGGFKQDGS